MLLALILKELVADAHLDVVSLAGEDKQRLVLRFPTEARDAAVVAAAVELAGYPESGLERSVGAQVVADDPVGDLLYQAGAEKRRGDPEHDVVPSKFSVEIVQGQRTAVGAQAP